MDETRPEEIEFFHYLWNGQPGKGKATRVTPKTIGLTLPVFSGAEQSYELPCDEREQRTLVVLDGELLWESIPKAGDRVLESSLGEVTSFVEHLRKPRFGLPWYELDGQGGRMVAKIALKRNFLLLPAGSAIFRGIRDQRSLSPVYVFFVVSKLPDGRSEVIWSKTTF